MKLQVTKRNRKFLNIAFLIEFIVLTVVIIATAKADTRDYSQFCAYVVGIPYASDNFTDQEYERFLFCKNALEHHHHE
jgi:hypothetical protein